MSSIITAAERAARRSATKVSKPTRAAKTSPPKFTGLGDAFALVAQPIARAIDAVAGTDIANCTPCKKRRERWNAALPFAAAPKAPPTE
jgi:hypothetical protein